MLGRRDRLAGSAEPAPTESPPPSAERPGLLGRLDRLAESAGLAPAQREAPPVEPDLPDSIEDLLPGRACETPHGPCYLIEQVYAPDAVHGDRAFGDVLDRDGSGAAIAGVDSALRGFDVRRALFLDTETTGLSSTMGTLAFLIGTAHFRAGHLVLEQWLLRDPDEEAATLYRLTERLAEADYLVTFNGRAFDVPLLRARFAANRMGDPSADLPGHFDLLHASRRLMKHDLPNCRLGTIENMRLGLVRTDDIPGAEVPAAYSDYLFGDQPQRLLDVVAHNRDDVLSMVTLVDELLARVEQAEAWLLRDPECGLALADQALRVGDLDYAQGIYRTAAALPETAEVGETGLKRVERKRRRAR